MGLNSNSTFAVEQSNNNVTKSNQSVIIQQDNTNDYCPKSNYNDKIYHNYKDTLNDNYLNYIQKGKDTNEVYSKSNTHQNKNNTFQYQQNLKHYSHEDQTNFSQVHQVHQDIHQSSPNMDYYSQDNANLSNYHQTIEQDINFVEMKNRIVENINDFYKENNNKPSKEYYKSNNYKEKESTYNLFDFCSKHNHYPFMNLFNYYFPTTPLNNNSK